MQSEVRACQVCKAEFTIEPEDFDFYKKIAVPAPTWCPECRLVGRLAFWPMGFVKKKRAVKLSYSRE